MSDNLTTIFQEVTDDIADATPYGATYGFRSIGGSAASTTAKYALNMPTERCGANYNMSHKKRGLALIFNHEFFDSADLNDRTGTNVDCANLERALTNLGFEVLPYKDCTLAALKSHLEWAARQNHSDYDCLLITVMSHGEDGIIYTKDDEYAPHMLWNYFTTENCPTLMDKPKLFFIQACRGDRLNTAVTLKSTQTDGDLSSYIMPVSTDILIAYSHIAGFYSWRNEAKGSWFIQSLWQELEENGTRYDLLTLLTFVSQRVALEFETNQLVAGQEQEQVLKQNPCVTTKLTRILLFNEKRLSSGKENV